MHLRRLAIRAYRSIVKADLRLGQITVVIGPTDTGKSNLVRALRDWSSNASGLGFITDGAGVARVGVAVGARSKVVWEKSSRGERRTTTRYVVADAETGENVSYEKIGLTVPAEVEDVTGMRPITIDDVRVNAHFSEQGEPWFLLANPPWTPGMVSKVIGRVSGVDALILANRDLVNKRTALRREAKTLRTRAEERRATLAEFDGLDALNELLARAERRESAAAEGRRKLDEAASLLRQVREKRRALDGARARTRALTKAVGRADKLNLVVNADRLLEATACLARIEGLRERVRDCARRAELARGRLDGCGDLLEQAVADSGLRCPLCGGSAHRECRAALARQARAARGGPV